MSAAAPSIRTARPTQRSQSSRDWCREARTNASTPLAALPAADRGCACRHERRARTHITHKQGGVGPRYELLPSRYGARTSERGPGTGSRRPLSRQRRRPGARSARGRRTFPPMVGVNPRRSSRSPRAILRHRPSSPRTRLRHPPLPRPLSTPLPPADDPSPCRGKAPSTARMPPQLRPGHPHAERAEAAPCGPAPTPASRHYLTRESPLTYRSSACHSMKGCSGCAVCRSLRHPYLAPAGSSYPTFRDQFTWPPCDAGGAADDPRPQVAKHQCRQAQLRSTPRRPCATVPTHRLL
jgi:hypothetical protein